VSGTTATRIVVVTGKGGVGKTTVAAATAVAAARTQRALVLSTDPAHSLGDVLGVRLGDGADEVAPGLVARQLDTRAALERSWPAVSSWLADVLGLAGIGRLEAEELAVVPGLDEVFALAELEAHARSGDHDVIVVDCAPTAEALRLLSLPDVVARYADRLAVDPVVLASTAVPAISRLLGLPVPPDGALEAVAGLRERLAGVRALLADPAVTTARVVLTPERVVLAEARRTATYLHLFGYALDAVVLNRTLPTGVRAAWADGWRRRQADVRAEATATFAPVPVLEHPLAADEPIGVDALGAFADECYRGLDPVARLADVAPWTFEERDGTLVVALRVPGVDGSDVELGLAGDELLVAVGPHRRAVALPAGLRRRAIGSARLVDGRLEVTFVEA
jgi:arsenite/tail-anchored protein-transporting ATPase